jgi:hypothetical protein
MTVARSGTTSMAFTEDDLRAISGAIGTEVENVGSAWDDAREVAPEMADYWRVRYEHLQRLHRRVESSRRRLARKT